MANIQSITIPDLGGAAQVDVIEILVKVGDRITKEMPLMTLEGDKASMELPSPVDGVIKEIKVKVGDKVSQNDVVMMAEVSGEDAKPTEKQTAAPATEPTSAAPTKQMMEVRVPDIGTQQAVAIIEIPVKANDTVAVDAPLITLESDKASMDVPSPYAGTIKEMKVKVGDQVKTGDLIAIMEATIAEKKAAAPVQSVSAPAAQKPASSAVPSAPASSTTEVVYSSNNVHAGPAVRRLAREFGADLSKVKGTGAKGRILKEDLQAYIKNQLAKVQQGGAGGFSLPTMPAIDFSRFGEIETKPLSKIKKLTAQNMVRNWITIPHVTQFAEADITEMEAFRNEQKAQADKQGVKLTPLVFIMKAVVAALKMFPQFNSSLDPAGDNLILKKYYNIGVAVDTPNGLVVPVIRDVDQKGMFDLAKELAQISAKARDKGLSLAEMQGSTFTISSLGGIGGNYFTPIINAPDVAILGVSRSYQKPVFEECQFIPRLTLPLSLSYDHRVIDGAEGARFIMHLIQCLHDIRTILL